MASILPTGTRPYGRALRVAAAALTLAAATGGLAACAGPSGGSGQAGSGSSAGSSGGSSGAPSPSEPSHKPPAGGAKIVLTGTASRGAEPGCVGLKADGKHYELSGAAAQKLGRTGKDGYQASFGKVRVRGRLQPATTASHCMMGRIVVVEKLTKL